MRLKSLSFLAFFLLSSWALMAQSNYEVLLHTGKQTFPENARDYAQSATISAQEVIDGHYYRLLQFYDLPNQTGLDVLENQGIELLEYIPNKTYLASIPASFDLEKLADLNVRSIVELTTELKIATELKSDILPEWATKRGQVEVMVKYHKNLRQTDILSYFKLDGIQVLKNNGLNNFLLASIPQTAIENMASLPYIAFMELRPAPDVKDDIEGRSLHRANAIDTNFPGGRSYTGEGVAVLTRDDGAVGPHIDFTGRLFQDPDYALGGTHGDGVSGIFAGAGNLDPRNRGMAAGADLYVIQYDATFLDNTMDLFFNNDVIVTNSSYSNGCNAGYTEITETVDQQIYDNPTLLHVFSAGNSNNNDCDYGAGNQWGNITGGHKQGKNVIATANLANNGILENSSSRGPAHDGRIKPDIAANGAQHISTDPDNEYSPFGGTSGASPGIAGITAMLHNAYAGLNGGETANSALLKAILLNTANDLGNVGPDYQFGWGHVNAYRAALTLEDNRYLTSTVEPGMSNTHTFDIPDNVAQARIMVYWMDQAGTVMATKALVNDINISVSGTDGAVQMPWILDPTPDPTTLNLPATTGVDDLNNMEQVALMNPEAGTYTLTVEGFELPFGAHDYYVTWDYRLNDITVIYPIGGEELVPGEVERIHWDAEGDDGSFDLEYSIDNGVSWLPISLVQGDVRMFDWQVPNELTAEALVRVSRGFIADDTSDAQFSIAPMPGEVTVEQVCPDYMRITWPAIADAASYDVYLLGQKYMEVVGNSMTNSFDIPITDPFENYWVAVDANYTNNATSRRTNAVFLGGGLTACPQENNLTTTSILEPLENAGFTCEETFAGNVTLSIVNNGTLPQENVSIGYQFDDEPIVVEPLGSTISPGQSVDFTFTTPFEITEIGTVQLTAWVNIDNETVPQDDTLRLEIPVFVGNNAPSMTSEDFEGPEFPKEFWFIDNPDAALTWNKGTVIGVEDTETEVTFLNFFSYPDQGQLDYFVMEPLDFTDLEAPIFLSFDLAYTNYSANFTDGMRIEVSTDCGSTYDQVIYEKFDQELATRPTTTNNFFPTSSDEWRAELADLSDFAGMDKIRIRFVAVNGYGNNLYLDNINIDQETVVPAVAGFEISPDLLCRNQPITFTSTSTGDVSTYSWSFGTGAVPPTATGEGPHEINYPLQGGDKTVQLIVSNALGADTMTTNIFIDAIPTGNFDSEIGNDGEVAFIANVDNANTITWDFGNGQTGTGLTPVAQFMEAGTYEVTMTITNDCGDRVITNEVEVMSTSAVEVLNNMNLRVFPNPNTGNFALLIENADANQLTLELTDLRGVVLQKMALNNLSGTIQQDFNQLDLSSGVYFLKITEEDKSIVKKVVVN